MMELLETADFMHTLGVPSLSSLPSPLSFPKPLMTISQTPLPWHCQLLCVDLNVMTDFSRDPETPRTELKLFWSIYFMYVY